MKYFKNSKIIPLVLSFAIILSAIGITFAYYYAEVSVANKFKTMTYSVDMEEEFYNTWGTKKVTITNKEKTNTPVVLRISYNESFTKTIDGIVYNPSNKINNEDVVIKGWTNTFLNDFVLGDDGWYYYNKVLSPEESIIIIESINLNEDLINDTYEYYKDYDYELSFNYEAIQADTKAIKKLWNIDASIDNKNIRWNL